MGLHQPLDTRLHNYMKTSNILIIFFILFTFSVNAQKENESNIVSDPRDAVEVIYDSKNLAKIEACFDDPSLRGWLISFLSDTTETPWKEKVVLTLLESKWPSDRQAGKPTPPGTPPPLASYQLAVELLAPLLPEENLQFDNDQTYRKLSSIEGRKKLVAKFREAQENGSDPKPRSHPESTRKPSRDIGDDFTSFPASEKPSSNKKSSPNINQSSSSPEKSSLPWIIAGVLLLGILLLLLLKIFKAKSTS